ncbi:MAG: hypothetical protein NG740_04480 [Omnitrophica bacterium]|nr:hypothetical protein [Candidatus Omnitrophota bacterium]
MRAEFKVNLKLTKATYIRRDMRKFKNEPQLRQLLVLAYQIKRELEKTPHGTLREISEWLGLTRGRISQILNLLFLAPKIQEDIVLSDKKLLLFIPEHKIRPIIKEIDWEKQREMWIEIKPNYGNKL